MDNHDHAASKAEHAMAMKYGLTDSRFNYLMGCIGLKNFLLMDSESKWKAVRGVRKHGREAVEKKQQADPNTERIERMLELAFTKREKVA